MNKGAAFKNKLITVTALFSALLFFCSCTAPKPEVPAEKPSSSQQNNQTEKEGFKTFMWVNYYELSMEAQGGGTAEQFTEKFAEILANGKKAGVTAAIVQLRPFCDAFYKSEIFPWSKYLTGSQGKAPGYDPLEIMCAEGKKAGIEIHGWINPYRVLYSKDTSLLSADSPFFKLKNANPANIIETEAGLFLNPARAEVKKLVIDGVREILRYDIDGIHMDDYFYPASTAEIDKADYENYRAEGGALSLEEWRRGHVNSLVSGIYSVIKQKSENTAFGISPAGDIGKNFNDYYADVSLWCSQTGFVDYIMPQLYYGFKNKKMPFNGVAGEWAELAKQGGVKIYAGLACYKVGKEDKYAGEESEAKDTGRYEWINSSGILAEQTKVCAELNFSGIALYSYQSIIEQAGEIELLCKVLENI